MIFAISSCDWPTGKYKAGYAKFASFTMAADRRPVIAGRRPCHCGRLTGHHQPVILEWADRAVAIPVRV
jgi:hypothetical protein